MIITTTQTVEGYQIVEYKWIVFGEVVAGVDRSWTKKFLWRPL